MFNLRLHPMFLLVLSLYVTPAFSGSEAVVNITEPANGAIIKAMSRSTLKYEVAGTDGEHARLYIDGQQSSFLRKRIGKHKLAKLSAGEHELCIKALNKSHKAVGKPNCVKITAQ